MTPAQLGNLAQNLFEKSWSESYGKGVYTHRLIDTKDVRSRSSGTTYAHVPKQPSDYVVTVNNTTHYAEVKGTSNLTHFFFSAFEKSQVAAMVRATAAGKDSYFAYVFSIGRNRWFVFPAWWILLQIEQGVKSIKFNRLTDEFNWIEGNKHGRI